MTSIAYVVCWKYSDNSAFGIIGYSFDKEKAEAMLSLLKEHCDSKTIYMTEVGQLPSFA